LLHTDVLLSRLTLRSGWWSEKKSLFDLSIVTGLTVSRLDQLEAQCRAWKGPLTAAVYLVVHVPTGATQIDGTGLESVQKAEKSMAEFHERCAHHSSRSDG
jgi:glycosyltransferase-like protein LARGE